MINKLSDQNLLDETDKLRKIEQKTTTELIKYYQEIHKRRLYCDLGFSSMFEYLTKHLKYSEAQASRRISAARLIQRKPAVLKKIEAGDITLTTASDLERFFKREETPEPKQTEIIDKATGLSRKECESMLNLESSQPVKKRVNLELTPELLESLEQVKDILGVNKIEEVLEKLCAEKIRKRKQELAKPVKAIPKTNGRTISIQVKRAVLQRAEERCEWVHPKTKLRCGCRRNLQYDHIKPYGIGGSNELDNIRLLCRDHNLRHAIKTYGVNNYFKSAFRPASSC